MQAKPYFLTLARYNLWATQRLLADVERVPEDEYRRERGLFFKSIHGTLNHLLVTGDRLWYPRFAQGISPRDVQLSDEAETDRVRLSAALIEGARRWIALVETFDVPRYEGELAYTTMRGTEAVLPFTATLAHVFNHGTHHRGQITTALTQLGQPGPEMDLVAMLQQEQT